MTFGLNCRIYLNMDKRKNNLVKICFATLVMALMVGAVSVYAPRQIKIAKTKREIAKTPDLIKKSVSDSLTKNPEYMNILFDSNGEYQKLVERNQFLFDSAVIEYRRRLESEFTVGHIFSDDDINEINRALFDYSNDEIQSIARRKISNKSEMEFWNFVMTNPITKNTSIISLTKILNKMHDMAFDGMSVKHNRIILADENKNKSLQKFYDSYYIDSPNFRTPEFSAVRTEYNKNLRNINRHQPDINRMHEIEKNIEHAVQQKFVARTDSLVRKLIELSR